MESNVIEMSAILMVGVFIGLILGLVMNELLGAGSNVFEGSFDIKHKIPPKIVSDEPVKLKSHTPKTVEKVVAVEKKRPDPPKVVADRFVKSNLKS